MSFEILLTSKEIQDFEHEIRHALGVLYEELKFLFSYFKFCVYNIGAYFLNAFGLNLFFRGLLLQKQGRYKEAIQCYENAIKYRPRLAGKS